MAAALRALSPFPSFPSHPSSSPPRCPSTTEVRFSRWNNANAESFVRRERLQQEIEDDLRRHRRYDSANRLADIPPDLDDLPFSATEFRSHGTPSSPSAPSIPGRASKYSKPPLRPRTRVRNPRSSDLSHPAFRPMQTRKFTRRPVTDDESAVSVGEHGISYKFEDAPFEFQYSYTETPKVKPLALREPPYLPFGPDTMPRPWTGRAPLPASKKKLPEFDSFRPPPPGKKGVKPVQSPGPFLAGSGPKYVLSREEILGEMLTEEEVNDLVKGCMKTTRQLNMGRDGLTHNMLDNMHAHWKRRRVCKIKCKGVCTVDMDNVRQQLEEKTGGKVIYNRGGVIFLFRGRNYNYKTRPRFPLMLWKPTPPVYPKLIQRVPEGLTVDEATELRKRGRELLPICKLGKNGVYINLVKDVKEAFEECELVRINCQGLHKSDCRKIGAKLKDLVPCVLLSFEYEHILMWRGKDWKSSLPPPEDKFVNVVESASDSGAINSVNLIDPLPVQQLRLLDIDTVENSDILVYDKMDGRSSRIMEDIMDENEEDFEDGLFKNQLESAPFESSKLIENTEGDEQECRSMSKNKQNSAFTAGSNLMNGDAFGLLSDSHEISDSDKRISDTFYLEISSQSIFLDEVDGGSELTNFSKPEISLQLSEDEVSDPCILHESVPAHVLDNKQMTETMSTADLRYESTISSNPSLDGVILLLKQAIENGSAIVLDNNSLDANDVYQRAVELAKTAPPGPVFRQRIPKATNQKIENTKGEEHSNQELVVESAPPKEAKRGEEKASWNQRKDNLRESFPDVVPHGSLRVDELAKLLA